MLKIIFYIALILISPAVLTVFAISYLFGDATKNADSEAFDESAYPS